MRTCLVNLLDLPLRGFSPGPLKKRDLLAGLVAIVAPELEAVAAVVPDYANRLLGVVITPGEPRAPEQIGPLLWHWVDRVEALERLVGLVPFALAAVEAAAGLRETAITQAATIDRLQRDLHASRRDYQQVTSHLRDQVHRLEAAEHDLRLNQAELRLANEQLEARVRDRTADLEDANRHLTEAIDQLHLAQDEIVRAEKLAALGSIVAGVSHELNTPIGNSLLVATTLQDRARSLETALETGIKRSQLARFIEESVTGADLLRRSLAKANELITSFKQVAVDQTSSKRRQFDLAEVIDEVAMTLRPEFRKTRHHLAIAVEPGLAMDSFPGPLGQVMTNLARNAILHGFEGRDDGTFAINGIASGPDEVELIFADNGSGIPRDHLNRIYDPFFTTKFGRGGSGLGLNIVHGLVTDVLGGTIAVQSELGEGTQFTVRLPRRAPHRSPADATAALGARSRADFPALSQNSQASGLRSRPSD